MGWQVVMPDFDLILIIPLVVCAVIFVATLFAFFMILHWVLKIREHLDTWYKELESLRRRLSECVSHDELESIRDSKEAIGKGQEDLGTKVDTAYMQLMSAFQQEVGEVRKHVIQADRRADEIAASIKELQAALNINQGKKERPTW